MTDEMNHVWILTVEFPYRSETIVVHAFRTYRGADELSDKILYFIAQLKRANENIDELDPDLVNEMHYWLDDMAHEAAYATVDVTSIPYEEK